MKNRGFSMTEIEKQQAEALLAEHAQLKGQHELEDWNIKAQTFLVFAAAKRICSAESKEEIKGIFSEA